MGWRVADAKVALDAAVAAGKKPVVAPVPERRAQRAPDAGLLEGLPDGGHVVTLAARQLPLRQGPVRPMGPVDHGHLGTLAPIVVRCM